MFPAIPLTMTFIPTGYAAVVKTSEQEGAPQTFSVLLSDDQGNVQEVDLTPLLASIQAQLVP